MRDEPDQGAAPEGTPGEVLRVFAKLGLTSFGGPIAHLGYFRDEMVTRRGWLSERAYGDLVALCQFLPGPASSQVGFALGLMRAGPLGAIAAFAAFTLPSALLLAAFALSAGALGGPVGTGALAGLKVVAVAIVAQAVWGMARALCPDGPRAAIALGAVALLALWPGAGGMLGAIALGLVAGLALVPPGEREGDQALAVPVSRGVALGALALLAVLFVALPLLAGFGPGWAVADAFFRAGALVFGGGHVVLPLLEAQVVAPGWVSEEAFLAGYGAAQAVPGPLFTFAAYLGAMLDPGATGVAGPMGPDGMTGPMGLAGAALATGAIFLPGVLLLIGVLPFWGTIRGLPAAQSALAGANAAVVGILGAALYDPVFTGAVGGMREFALALGCFLLLTVWRVSPWGVVLVGAAGGVALAFAPLPGAALD